MKSLPTVKTFRELNHKYPGGIEKQTGLLEAEGFEVIKKGKKTVVYEYSKYLIGV